MATRGNLYYDESTTTDAGYQNPAHPEAPLCTQDSDSWEPPAEVKGDLARAMFYMDIRYEGGGTEPDLMLTDNVALISTSAAYMGRLSTLLLWNFLDPVSPAEAHARRTRLWLPGQSQSFRGPPRMGRSHLRPCLPPHGHPQRHQSRPRVAGRGFPADLAILESSTDFLTWPAAALTITTTGGQRTATVPLRSPARTITASNSQPRPG